MRLQAHAPTMSRVPYQDFRKLGYGMIPVREDDWDIRIAAVKHVLGILSSGEMPPSTPETFAALNTIKGMFARIFVGDCYDWYTTSRLLGHPSAELSSQVAHRISDLRDAILRGDGTAFAENVNFLTDDFVDAMLDNYLDIAERAKHPVEEEGWAYILWSSKEPDALFIGAAGGYIEEVTYALRAPDPEGQPYGVLAAWLVHDAVDAYRSLAKRLAPYSLGGGFYRMDLGLAKHAVAETLSLSNNTVLSPWHVEEHDNAPSRAMGM